MCEYESGVDVCLRVHLVYLSELLCHVHDLSGGPARQRRACVMPFRLLQELSVTQGEVSGKERRPEASGGGLRGGHLSAKQRWQLQSGLRALVGHRGDECTVSATVSSF